MKKYAMIALACFASMVHAQPDVTSVQARLKELYPATQITSVRAAEVPGLYEVTMRSNVAYTDASGRYFVFGRLFDMQEQVDLTAERLAEANKVDFGALPLDAAIKRVHGDGTRKLALFSDPDCPYCKRLEETLAKLDNVTIYTFPYPLAQLHPDAARKAANIWCAPDRAKAWDEFMMTGKEAAARDCKHPLDRIAALGQALGVNGTPTMFTADGRRVSGAVPLDQIERALQGAEGRAGAAMKVVQPVAGGN
jgi:thiol:disulfide interchange protein DsbC